MGYSSFCKSGTTVVACQSFKRKESGGVPAAVKSFKFKDLEEATKGFAGETLLGKGSHGCVYKGTLENGMDVAVKRSSYGGRVRQDETAFDNEIQILSRLDNPGLVKLVGLCHDSKEKILVVEFMPNGTLYDILHHKSEALSWHMRLHLACQTGKAVLALHKASPPIIHRDIKSSNVLIDSNWNAKLGDFGLALSGNDGLSTPPAGTLGYLDPEYTTPDMLSTKNDVFSFGILLLEIMSGRNAIDVHYNPPNILDWAVPLIKAGKTLGICDPRLPPPRSKIALKQLGMIAARCVRDTSKKRPSMEDVVQQLEEILKRFSFSVFGISCKVKKTAINSDRQKSSLKSTAPTAGRSPRRSYPRSPKVHDESRNLRGGDKEGAANVRKAFQPSQSFEWHVNVPARLEHRMHGKKSTKRALLDLFKEGGEQARGEGIDCSFLSRATRGSSSLKSPFRAKPVK